MKYFIYDTNLSLKLIVNVFGGVFFPISEFLRVHRKNR